MIKDIINIEKFEPKYHKRMTMEERAAQFSPFKALTGYEENIEYSNIIEQKKIILSEDGLIRLDEILKRVTKDEKYEIEYYCKTNKDKGKYIKTISKIKIDEIKKVIILESKEKINICDIIDIQKI